MVTNYLPIPDIDQAPPIVKQLRDAFDERLESLYREAMKSVEQRGGPLVGTIHVPFAFAGYEVEAMYDTGQDLFTQVVARPLMDTENARPAFTISLFLVQQD